MSTITKLELKAESKKSDHALAAANIRRELKAAFPTIKFSVRSDCYSMGDSVDISWELGPTEAEVSAITGKYADGTFNGMTDSYEYDHDRSWTGKYGSAQYVHCTRDCSKARPAIEAQLAELYRAESPYDLQTSAWRILQKYAFPAGAVVTGVEHTERTCGLIEDVFQPTFTTTTTTKEN
jgi:hypothetical protein